MVTSHLFSINIRIENNKAFIMLYLIIINNLLIYKALKTINILKRYHYKFK